MAWAGDSDPLRRAQSGTCGAGFGRVGFYKVKPSAWQWSIVAISGLATGIAQGAIYADFTTSQGVFTVALDALAAPRAVANFIDLAEGTQTWRDPVTGAVRGGAAGDSFYNDMQFYSTVGTRALLGGLRPYRGSDGNEYWEGPGYTILDETTNGVNLDSGVLAMPEFTGPHSGGGELALVLSNAAAIAGSGWTGFGAVTGAGLAVVMAVVNEVTNGSGRVIAQIAIRDEDMTPGESAALAAARSELPAVTEMPLGLNGSSNSITNAVFELSPQSQACLATTSNLLIRDWSVLPGDWNTGTNEQRETIPFASIPGLAPQRGFLFGSQATYPKMTADVFAGLKRIAVAHTGVDMQYWLDFTGGTGMWAQVVGGVPVQSGSIDWIGQELATANSLHLVLFIGMTAYHYWLGFDEAAATSGRFYCELWDLNAELSGTDSGTFVYEEGWGKKRAMPKAVTGSSVQAKAGTAMQFPKAWQSNRTVRRGPGIPIGGLDLIGN